MEMIEHIENQGVAEVNEMQTEQNALSEPTNSETAHAAIKTFSTNGALQTFNADFFAEDVCQAWILKALHPDGAYCPRCGQRIEDEITLKNFWMMLRCKCKSCQKWFTATVGTILHNSQLTMRQSFALAVLMALGLTNKQIAGIIGIHPDSVRFWRMRLKL